MYYQLNKRILQFSAIVLVLVAAGLVSQYYVEWLWFESLGYNQAFMTMLLSEWAVYLAVFASAFLIVSWNLERARRNILVSIEEAQPAGEDEDVIYLHPVVSPWAQLVKSPMARWGLMALALVTAFLLSASTGNEWLTVQQFIHKQPFGLADPLFNQDISFYFFDLKFYQLIYNVVLATLILALVLAGTAYIVNAGNPSTVLQLFHAESSKVHISLLLAAILLIKIWGYRLSSYALLFDFNGIVFGATYADINARLFGYQAMMVISGLVIALIAYNIYSRRHLRTLYALGAWLLMASVLNYAYPLVIQKFVVQPNEFNMEQPYIEEAIKFTRLAYGLDDIETRSFDIKYDLDANKLQANSLTVDNIRLWDWQPLTSTYKSLQELRLYYVFKDIDVDRYTVEGRVRQVMISAREMEEMDRNSALPAQAKTWVNQRLMFTHGYGVVMSPVTEVAQEGFPRFFVKDIPPQSDVGIEISQPQIYFGESTDSYVVVNARQEEFDYPMGDTNMYTTYQGSSGLQISSFARRLLLAWELGDYKLILATDITNDSQVLMKRNIVERVETLAPYLRYDSDPYIIVNQEDGKLYWMIDAYTVSESFPYSQPYLGGGTNYIRNSVKIIVDAYTGEVDFYVVEDDDPIIRTCQQIFPGMYKPLDEMPAGLKSHIRYPVDMFTIQAKVYATFHMTDPWVFYNKEDSWVIPNEIIENQERAMEPYYIIMRLPGAEKAEYILMLPYSPNGRPNMIAWMCARMDNDDYGRMLVYTFPKQETVYGPMQVESRINQNTEISKQLTLWDQKGSGIYRGNLIVIPIEQSLLYIEPLYLQAASSQMPELKRVIAAYGDNVVMETSLSRCLERLFGLPGLVTVDNDGQEVSPDEGNTAATVAPDISTELLELVEMANDYYLAADQAARDGNWAEYGDNLNKLGLTLEDLQNRLMEQ